MKIRSGLGPAPDCRVGSFSYLRGLSATVGDPVGVLPAVATGSTGQKYRRAWRGNWPSWPNGWFHWRCPFGFFLSMTCVLGGTFVPPNEDGLEFQIRNWEKPGQLGLCSL
jgi:hypothetical protein